MSTHNMRSCGEKEKYEYFLTEKKVPYLELCLNDCLILPQNYTVRSD